MTILNEIGNLDPRVVRSESDRRAKLQAAVSAVIEMEPTNATESMLAAQMVGTQRLAMEFLRRAALEKQPSEAIDRCISRATRLMSLFIDQIDAMAKLKGKAGQQHVIVEHVTVAAGGQAIVGAVTHQPGGGGRGA